MDARSTLMLAETRRKSTRPHDFFREEDAVWIRLSANLLKQISISAKPVLVYCWLLGKRATEMIVGPSDGTILDGEGSYLGLNTERLGGKNCHVELAPLEYSDGGRCAVIALDCRFKREPCLAEFPDLDLAQAIFCREEVTHL